MDRSHATRTPCPSRRRGFTLLEVILALTVAVAGVVAANELIRLGLEEVDLARAESVAVLLARSKLAEYQAGMLVQEEDFSGTVAEDDPRQFTFSVLVEDLAEEQDELEGLDRVTVIVGYTINGQKREYVLTQWVQQSDPQDQGGGLLP